MARARPKIRHPHILDNRERTVAEYLRKCLDTTEALRVVSAYFSIYGYELLEDALSDLDDVRLLFGDPTSVEDLDPAGKDPKSFELTEDGLAPNFVLKQKALARLCAKWIKGKSVKVRSISKSNFLHGKMYLAEGPENGAAVVGSSNFTRSGLGGGSLPNLEINVATTDLETRIELCDWFDKLWNDQKLTEDVKGKVLAVLNRIGKDHGPEIIYFKTLYELFRADLEDLQDGERQLADIHLYDTQVWNVLYGFQRDGAKSVIARLLRHSGCILADSVGLGKTYTALAVIKFFELRNERVLVLCPKKLRENWALYPAYNAQTSNPFQENTQGMPM